MTFASFAMLIAFSVLLAGGQILFKSAADAINTRETGSGLLSFLSFPLLAALILYASATILWVYVLTKVPLSRAYPFALVGAAIVPVAAAVFYGERIGSAYPFGFLLILAGLYLCVR
ncbi:MAG: hypothetical protein V2I43_26570 [Parvularcula sp.]|jgi:drug/metabolite transporter (DMT)-like permease|nr:hypothetical protein [Parvularcula sp.]